MKYSKTNPPLVCMMTQSTCYKGTRPMTVKGVLWHSTGANNPWIKRYVQPDDKAPNRQELLKIIGTNTNKNDWNHIDRQAGVNCWIGKFADGTISTVQALPWDYRPWGCGAGNKGSCNNGWIQFEICESDLNDSNYFKQVYQEGCEITAYLCMMYNIDPLGTAPCDKVSKCPTILCHKDSYNLGLGSGHEDVLHWLSKYGKTMDDVRKDVYKLMQPAKPEVPNEEEIIWNYLYSQIKDEYGVAGLMGNLYAESGLKSNNLENAKEKTLKHTDESYTEAVDSGRYKNFAFDGAKYGLLQWGEIERKDALLKYTKSKKVSVGDLQVQLEYLMKELNEDFTTVLHQLQCVLSVKSASDIVLIQLLGVRNPSEEQKNKRASYSKTYMNKYGSF